MRVSAVSVPVRRGPMITTAVTVGEHEVAVLQAVHKDEVLVDLIQPTAEFFEFEPGEEYMRLARHYGEDDKGTEFVSRVYGTPHEFQRRVGQIAAKSK